MAGSFNFTKAAEEKNAENLLIISQESWQRFSDSSDIWKREMRNEM